MPLGVAARVPDAVCVREGVCEPEPVLAWLSDVVCDGEALCVLDAVPDPLGEKAWEGVLLWVGERLGVGLPVCDLLGVPLCVIEGLVEGA